MNGNIFLAKLKKKKDPNKQEIEVVLSQNERTIFEQCLAQSTNYLEFGSGGSTYLALNSQSIQRIVSVESDPNWLDHLRTFDIIKNNEGGKLNFYHVDIGKTGEWGVPTEDDKRELFPNYSHEVFTKYENNYDLVFVDGRFRVACTLQTILNCPPDVKIVMHDYNNRPEYHRILEFLDIVYTIDTMAVFMIKPEYNRESLLNLYENYKYVFR